MFKRIKKIILGTLAVLLMFTPLYIAVANYMSLGNWQNTLTGETTVITVKNADGATVFGGEAGMDSNMDLAKLLANMLENGKSLRAKPDAAQAADYVVTAQLPTKDCDYHLYYNATGSESHLFDESANVYYEVKSTDMLPFLQSFFHGETAESLSIPILTTAGNEVIPSYISWNHKNPQGHYNPVMNLTTVSEEATYPVNKNILLRFSVEPDEASVKVYNGSTEVFSGDYEDFGVLTYEDSVNLTIMVQAKWEESAEHAYYGEASYQFHVNYSAVPAFSISATTATVGDYIAINVLNASAPENITFSSTPDIGCTPVFCRDGEYVRALIPLNAELSGGVYRLTVSTKGSEETFEVTLEERDSPRVRSYDAGSDLIKNARSAAALEEYSKLLKEIGQKSSDIKYFSGTFDDYRKSINATLLLGYGHIRTLSTDESYRMDGIDFTIYRGTDIPALNNGMVIATGENAYLGKYVIVDHGLSLRSWYCHLSEVSVSVGDTVQSGQAVGKSGSTGFTTGSGVYLICTIGSTPISPYTLWDYGVVYE